MASLPPQASHSTKWQDELAELSRSNGFQRPVYDVYSDRRGGRTAWSASVRVEAWSCAARFWYDGPYVNNAKEEAAEALVKSIRHEKRWNAKQLDMEEEAEDGMEAQGTVQQLALHT